MKDVNETQNLGEQLKVRREKLKLLQDSGQDPFSITKFNVTARSKDILDNFDGKIIICILQCRKNYLVKIMMNY